MELLLFVLAGGGVALAARRLWGRHKARREEVADLAQVRKVADEDITLLGEELSQLDADVAEHQLDAATRRDYQRALDAYESAQFAVKGMKHSEAISTVTDTLATGRYAIVCVRARVAGRAVPERRVPCFFNPQHGPSTTEIVWTRPRYGTRTVPACSQDAARIRAGDQPEIRYVQLESRRVPYWEAGHAFAPYGQGYFAGGGAGASFIAIASFGDISGGHDSWGDWSGSDGHGGGGGYDGGGAFDGGGYDGGGYDGGGSDGGGSS